jgi:ferritin-like protein
MSRTKVGASLIQNYQILTSVAPNAWLDIKVCEEILKPHDPTDSFESLKAIISAEEGTQRTKEKEAEGKSRGKDENIRNQNQNQNQNPNPESNTKEKQSDQDIGEEFQ